MTTNQNTVTMIGLHQLMESKTNPRRGKVDVTELADSIREKGVLSPLRVRPKDLPKGTVYEVIFGGRRLAAAAKAGFREIPCIIQDADDREVMEMQLVENSQREDVHPMDEAQAYEILSRTISVEEIIKKTGKSRSHVLRRMRLLQLPPKARKAFQDGRMTHDVAVQIARLPAAGVRKAVTDEILGGEVRHEFDPGGGDYVDMIEVKGVPGPAAVAELIKTKYLLKLKDAPFKTGIENLVKGCCACKDCEHRTGNQSDLFGDVGDDDLCTLPECFERKREAGWLDRAVKARKDGIRVIEDEAAKKICPFGSHNLKGFVKPDDVDYTDAKSRTYRKILGAHAPDPVLIRTEDWEVFEAWDQDEVRKRLKAYGLRKDPRVVTSNRDGMAKMRRDQRVGKEMRTRTLARIVNHVHTTYIKSDIFMRLVVEVMAGDLGCNAEKALLKRREVKSLKQIMKNLKDADSQQLHGLIADMLIGDPGEEWTSRKPLDVFCRAFGIDQKQIKATVRKEMAPKKKKAKVAKKAKKNKKEKA